MPRPRLRPLPEPDRRAFLDLALGILDRHESLGHFRSLVRTGPERQLALLAALERSVQDGSPAAHPPGPSEEPDQLLCDILDIIDRHPDLKGHGSAYGPDRHLANLQALGIWRGTEPITQPSARELFAACFSSLSAAPASTSPASDLNCSPAPQDVASRGEQFGPQNPAVASTNESPVSLQPVDAVVVVTIAPDQEALRGGLLREGGAGGDDLLKGAAAVTVTEAAERQVRGGKRCRRMRRLKFARWLILHFF